ncbi:uncharacterized protein FIBRA_08455 [Fibroporia radiculosa]|uniref:Wax synthase domain-containing protein n=1 Tax=Fibroporia radiculosa TaxID=599839 RepID=J4ICD3_9APHY|nr:uncharacterized protein FIBRA_08455 [Fibroporia radiculosa]CCM06211.1 predicted protein [Fibroporia radiculosa]
MSDHARPSFPMLPYLTLQHAFLAALIVLRPRWPFRLGAFTAYGFSLMYALRCSTGNSFRDHTLGCILLGHFFTAIHLIWITNPIKEFMHERDRIAPERLPFDRRALWALCIFNNPRGVGWNYQLSNIPSRPSEPRWTFVRERLKSAFRWFLLVDLMQLVERTFPQRGADFASLSLHGCTQRCCTIGAIAMQYYLLAAGSVALGWFSPSDWPDVYGRLSDAYTLRRFWGRTYHQFMRRYLGSLGKVACRLFNLQSGSWASSYLQLYVAFAISGLIHCGGDFMANPALFGASFPFYISQAIAITFEDVAIGVAKRTQIRWSELFARRVGYAWVLISQVVLSTLYLNWLMRAGLAARDRMSFSLIDALGSIASTGLSSSSFYTPLA